ncbi:MAG: aspartate dehydrogenase [Micavibrio aeruginosavorus]|uniref:L-aspartate dehydrogenase n=1 Tax=Micavibrio aeruginosavorus TaxID=349221 RepID=A0A2W5Q268_9BACT|nr:MAG: aspartate dehydrogenase [Micavibrio aeruginosavorus]
MNEKVGIAGVGALGSIVAKAFPMDGYVLHAVSDKNHVMDGVIPNVDFAVLARECDVIVECLPAAAAKDLAEIVLSEGKTLILISACALVLYPELSTSVEKSSGGIIVPSGALSGLDAVLGMKEQSIKESKIISSKPPAGFKNAPYILEKNINLDDIKTRVMIFSGNVFEAAKAFPANVNVAASLALAGIGPEKTQVEVWADPDAKSNSHEIIVTGAGSIVRSKIENVPDPANPKSSQQAAYSIIAALKKRKSNLTIY